MAPSAQVGRLRGRSSFAELRSGRRARVPPLNVTYVPGRPGELARVGFAVSRRVGPAVVRNRIRRRLRAITRELAGEDRLAPGAYLIATDSGAASASYGDLRAALVAALERLQSQGRAGD